MVLAQRKVGVMKMKIFKSVLPKAIGLFIAFSIICGGIYSFAMTGISQVCFNKEANGSIIEVNGKKYGSSLLGQQFTGDQYLWGRVMNIDTTTFKDAEGKSLMYAAPSNISPASESYKTLISERVKKLKDADPDQGDEPVPVDLVTVSGSGLDPHISVAAAEYQVNRVAKARGLSKEEVQQVIDKYTTHKLLGVLGEDVVNVLQVNLALDGILK